jgi:hypothetical protein
MLGGFCFAGTTPWPKHTGVTGTHYYINAPNAQGPNGEGDSSLELYLSTEFAAGDLIVGINIETYDFNLGVAGFTYKALEMRLENPATLGCPDWVNPALGAVVPVPYLSNYAFLNQYPYAAPVPYPTGFNTVSVVQYNPGQNVLTTGCPLVAGDAGPGSGFGYFWDAGLQSCAGPMSLDWCQCFYGNGQIPEVAPKVVLANRKYSTDSDTTAMVPGTELKMVLHLQNNSGSLWGPGNLSLWVRNLMSGYQGFAGTGLDLLDALSGGSMSNPMTLVIPPISLGGSVNLTGNMGGLFDYGFSAYTLEATLSGGSPFIFASAVTDAQFCPLGCEDDNSAETYYYVQSPQQWGDGMCKRFAQDLQPSGAFTVTALDWAPGDFGGAGSPLVHVGLYSEGTLGSPNVSTGLLGTFDRSSVSPGTLYRATCYDLSGNVGVLYPGPVGNTYVWAQFDPNYFLIAVGSSTSGPNHKTFRDSYYSLGPNQPPPPFNSFTAQLCMRLAIVKAADGGFQGNGELAPAVPTIAAIK